jgi:hypothetical protein
MSGDSSKLPPEIQKACKILGITENDLTARIIKAWKAFVVNPLNTGDDALVFATIAKDVLLRWVQRFD